MIQNILKLLNSDPWFGLSKEIEIAKGKNKLKLSFKEIKYQIKRDLLFIKRIIKGNGN